MLYLYLCMYTYLCMHTYIQSDINVNKENEAINLRRGHREDWKKGTWEGLKGEEKGSDKIIY